MNKRQPALFFGHGSPMNAIEDNDFTRNLKALGEELRQNLPRAIAVVSAHWITEGTKVLALPQPRTIHDFGGFPRELYEIQYPAPGSPADAEKAVELLRNGPHHFGGELDSQWGLDHGTWSVLRHLFPQADVPVFQVSLDIHKHMKDHLAVGEELRALRDQGVLLIGSGNITHNLRRVNFAPDAAPVDWAVEFDERIARALENDDRTQLLAEDPSVHALWRVAHPSIDHYLPLLSVVGARHNEEKPVFPYVGLQAGTLSMRSVRYG